MLGEYGIPNSDGANPSDNDREWLTVLDNFLDTLQSNSDVIVGATYWAGGPWWGNYPLSTEPSDLGQTTTSIPTRTATPPRPASTATATRASLCATGFEGGDPLPAWTNTGDGGGYPAGGLMSVTGVCCRLSGPEAGVRGEKAYTGHDALLYSGYDDSTRASYAYDEIFDLSARRIVVGPATTLSYWIYPQSSRTAPVPVGGSNSACVAIDLIFADGSNLRDAGAVDQSGARLHPAAQCRRLALDTWNHVTSIIGAKVAGKTIVRLDVGYDQPANTGGYRGYIDDIDIHN